jgi:hypothetical protein
MREKREPYRILVGKSKAKKTLGSSERTMDNIMCTEIYIKKIGLEASDKIHITQDRD